MTLQSLIHLQDSLLILVIALAVQFTTVCGATILTPQNDSVVPYNSDEIVTYNCEVNSGLEPLWTINNFQLQNYEQKQDFANNKGIMVEDRNNTSMLNFNVTRCIQSISLQKCARLVIECQPFIDNPPDPLVQRISVYGPLDTPSNLQFSAVSEHCFRLSWTGTTLPEGVVVINFIQVTNLSSNATKEFNTTQDFLIFNKIGECSKFSLSVVSFNEEVGYSDVESITQTIPISPDVFPISRNLTTIVKFSNATIFITITFLPAEVICMPEFPVENYTVILENNTLPIPVFSDDLIQADINDTVIPGLSMDQAIKYTIEACTNVTCRTTSTFTTYTTGVQMPTVYFLPKNRFILAVCNFSTGSRARGCFFNFTFINSASGEVDTDPPYELLSNSTENSTLCTGGLQACMCLSLKRFVTSYSAIDVYTLEEDGVTRSAISVPAIKKDVSMNSALISTCNPPGPTIGPQTPGNDSRATAGIVGGVLGAVVVLIIIVSGFVVWCLKNKWINKQIAAANNLLIKNFGIIRVPSHDGDSTEQLMGGSDNDAEEPPKPVEITLNARVVDVSCNGNISIEILDANNKGVIKNAAETLLKRKNRRVGETTVTQ